MSLPGALVEKAAVVAGLTRVSPAHYGGWDGACPGSDIDARNMAALLEREGFRVATLTNSEATSYRFVKACVSGGELLRPAAAAGLRPLLVVYYSGHGGQVTDLDGDEGGGKDSTLCLWDGQMTDDLMWAALTRIPAGVRVAFVADCCNSGSVYRGPHDFVSILRARNRKSGARDVIECSLMMFSGCPDGQSSYGNAKLGGEFTSRLIRTFIERTSVLSAPALTWRQWFDYVAATMPRNQTPVFTELGRSFSEMEALK